MTKAQGQNKENYQTEYQTPFQKIPQACKTTGLSKYYLRKGCKSGEIPHITSGGVYYINVPKLLEMFDSAQGVGVTLASREEQLR